MKRRLTLIAAVGVGTLMASLGVTLAVLGTAPTELSCPRPANVDAVQLDAPASIVAGDRLIVTVGAHPAFTSLPATVALVRADGPIVRQLVLRDGLGAATFAAPVTIAAGSATIFATVCDVEVSRPLVIEPGPVVAPVEVLVGPRRIKADGKDEATAVTVPIDEHGNPVSGGTPVEYTLQRADGRVETATVPTERLVGVMRVAAGTVAGASAITARSGTARGALADLIESPGAPRTGFPLSVERITAVGSAADRLVARIEDVEDRFGNPLADGALVTLVAHGAGIDGAQAQATLIAASATIGLPSTSEAGTLTVQAFIDGVGSTIVSVDVTSESPAREIPLLVRPDGDVSAIAVIVGPVLGELGAYAPDGSSLTVEVTAPDGTVTVERLPLVDGVAELNMRAAESGTYWLSANTPFGRAEATVVMP